jgi:hypothetical protein
MLLARLVTGRYSYAAEDQPRPAAKTPGKGWFAWLLATIHPRKKTG